MPMLDINSIKSHPNKLLTTHLYGVKEKTLQLTNDKTAAMLALWHDLGKVNTNFQKMLEGQNIKEKDYSHHSYFSSFALFCACSSERKKFELLIGKQIDSNDLLSFIIMIAKHHRDLPDFCPKDTNYELDVVGINYVLDVGDINKLFENISLFNIPQDYYSVLNVPIENLHKLILIPKIQLHFKEKMVFQPNKNHSPIDFFLNTQNAFSCLIHADKADAANFDDIIGSQHIAVSNFSKIFSKELNSYISQLDQDTALNRLRTEIRLNAVSNIKRGLQENRRVFELASPTGSGKTLMLLSLASEIICASGAKRVIYALPFLSITEQVEHEISQVIFKDYKQYIQRIDSKSENTSYTKLQEKAENGLSEEQLHRLNTIAFMEQSFSYPFIITTFVRFFETLFGNQNAELIKLPNFSNCIFLLDEIQTLPPRLYGFSVAYLTRFCEKFNSYAVISTATQPNFELPSNDSDGSGNGYKITDFFPTYKKPYRLSDLSYFQHPLFNRYVINYRNNPIDLEQLAKEINSSTLSTLVILNTIDGTKELYKKIETNNKILLNTHFTPADRKCKIENIKRLLQEKQSVIVISTQLVEAGVDIDFPVVYRDMTTVSSIIQSAGRCNRNGKMESKGKVYLVNIREDGKDCAQFVYDKELLKFTRRALEYNTYEEASLLTVQQQFFDSIQSELKFGCYSLSNGKERFFLDDIKKCMFKKIGSFSLIDENVYGEEISYYVPENEKDDSFEVLLEQNDTLNELWHQNSNMEIIKNQKRRIETQLRRMQNRIVQIRLKRNDYKPIIVDTRPYYNLHKLSSVDYSTDFGVNLSGSSFF